jgi:hypothetical protein
VGPSIVGQAYSEKAIKDAIPGVKALLTLFPAASRDHGLGPQEVTVGELGEPITEESIPFRINTSDDGVVVRIRIAAVRVGLGVVAAVGTTDPEVDRVVGIGYGSRHAV